MGRQAPTVSLKAPDGSGLPGEAERETEREEETAIRLRTALTWVEEALGEQEGGEPGEAAIASLARAVQLRSGEDPGHGPRVGAYCRLVARRLGIGEERADRIGLASQLHDLGKLAVPASLLLKPGPSTESERQVVERHPEIG